MSTENRVEFTKLVSRELAAFAVVFVIAFALTYTSLGLIYFFTSNDVFIGKSPFVSKAFEAFFFTALTLIPFLIIYFWRLPHYKEKIKEWKLEQKKLSIPILISLGLIIGLLLFALSHLIELVIINFYGENYLPANHWLEFKSSAIWERLLIFGLLAIFLPIVEELFYRVMIFGNLLRGGFPKTAYILSILLFAISYNSLTFFFYNAFAGLIFAFLYHKTRSIIPPIIANIFLNICLFSFLFFS